MNRRSLQVVVLALLLAATSSCGARSSLDDPLAAPAVDAGAERDAGTSCLGRSESECDSRTCEYLYPGCGPDALPAPGCFPRAPCTPESCAGGTCVHASIDSCRGAAGCLAECRDVYVCQERL